QRWHAHSCPRVPSGRQLTVSAGAGQFCAAGGGRGWVVLVAENVATQCHGRYRRSSEAEKPQNQTERVCETLHQRVFLSPSSDNGPRCADVCKHGASQVRFGAIICGRRTFCSSIAFKRFQFRWPGRGGNKQ